MYYSVLENFIFFNFSQQTILVYLHLKLFFSYCLLVIEYPIDIWANSTIIHYQHWSIIILINILITPFETSYALWLAKTDLFTAIPILRYYQRKCVFIAGKKNNDSCKYHLTVEQIHRSHDQRLIQILQYMSWNNPCPINFCLGWLKGMS